MSDNNHDTWGSLRGVQMVCDKVCGYKRNRARNVDTWWRNSGESDEAQKKTEAYKEMTIMNAEH